MRLHHEADRRMNAEATTAFGDFCPKCAVGRYDECPEARRIMGIPETVHHQPERRQGERRTLVRRRADPHSAGVLRGDVSPWMGEVAEVEPRPLNWPDDDECVGECHHVFMANIRDDDAFAAAEEATWD